MSAYPTRQVSVRDLRPYPGNPRKDHDIDGIVAAIQLAGGFRVPIVVWEGDGYILAGHGRLLAAQAMGLDKVPVHFVGADEIDEERAIAWRIADNRVGEQSGWDERQLLEQLELISEARRREAGFDADDEEMLRWRTRALDEPEIDPRREWGAMPEFKQEHDGHRTLLVHFENEAAVQEFAVLVGQPVTERTKFAWFPRKPDIDVTTTTRVVATL